MLSDHPSLVPKSQAPALTDLQCPATQLSNDLSILASASTKIRSNTEPTFGQEQKHGQVAPPVSAAGLRSEAKTQGEADWRLNSRSAGWPVHLLGLRQA